VKFKIRKEVKERNFNLFLLLFCGFLELKYFYKVRIYEILGALKSNGA
jgi:hypothetical protein